MRLALPSGDARSVFDAAVALGVRVALVVGEQLDVALEVGDAPKDRR